MCTMTGVLVAVGISGRFDSSEKSVAVGCEGVAGGSGGGGGGFSGATDETPGRLQAKAASAKIESKKTMG